MQNIIYAEFLNEWTWQWFATLTFLDVGFNKEKTHERRLRWTRSLSKKEKLRVGYYYALVFKDRHPHLHLLMIGRNKYGKTLNDVDSYYWQKQWDYIARIEKPMSNVSVSNYFSANLAEFTGELGIYNVKLL